METSVYTSAIKQYRSRAVVIGATPLQIGITTVVINNSFSFETRNTPIHIQIIAPIHTQIIIAAYAMVVL